MYSLGYSFVYEIILFVLQSLYYVHFGSTVLLESYRACELFHPSMAPKVYKAQEADFAPPYVLAP